MYVDGNRIQIFHEIYRLGSISKAAEKLCRTQSAISQQLKVLEDELGGSLFHRDKKGLELTILGQSIMADVTAVMSSLDSIKRKSIGYTQGQAGILSIGASDTSFLYYLKDPLKQFSQLHPHMEMKIINSKGNDLLSKMDKGELEAVVLALSQIPQHCHGLDLGIREDILISNSMVKKNWKDIVRESVFIYPDQNSNTRQFIDTILHQHSIVPAKTIEAGSIVAIKSMVELGLGCSIIPCIALDKNDTGLYAYSLKGEQARHLYLLTKASRPPSPPLKELINILSVG
ncbi:LysR family transcriptional regulator [Spirochaeta cellobiosiphila]|uniref:LysR family transcriptional regulator n=1 Tax=Spirochaeta cellobiosiphila TaxID=504483 RepID=UPI0004109352|nr:LysR family transcriptional regulator [Spirochaeta cellobiosiphila]